MLTHSGVHTSGVWLYPRNQPARFTELLAAIIATQPTHLVIAAPIVPAIRWRIHENLTILPLFADSFRRKGLKGHIRNWLLARLLNRPSIEYVANHKLAASLNLTRIGGFACFMSAS